MSALASDEQTETIWLLMHETRLSGSRFREEMRLMFGKWNLSDLTRREAALLIGRLRAMQGGAPATVATGQLGLFEGVV